MILRIAPVAIEKAVQPLQLARGRVSPAAELKLAQRRGVKRIGGKVIAINDRADRLEPALGAVTLLLGTAEGFRPVSTLLYAMGGRQETPILPVLVIREKSQFRAQHDFAVIESPLMSAPAFVYTSEPWAALSFGRPIFAPAFVRKRMSADHLPQSSSASRLTAGAAGFSLLTQCRGPAGPVMRQCLL